MTVEEYLRAQVPGYEFDKRVLEYAAISPMMARPEQLTPIALVEIVEDNFGDDEFIRSLKYATSTLYYAISGVFSGGSRSEQVGDVRTSKSGFTITQSDREYYRAMADKLRGEIGAEVEEDMTVQTIMFDACSLAKRPKSHRRWSF